jgi:hypothetical protein
MVAIAFRVERNDFELELEVHGDYTPAVRGRRYGHPDTWTPDDAEEAEITKVLYCGKLWDGELTGEEQERAEEALREAEADDCDGYDDRGDDDHFDLEDACSRLDHWGSDS